MTTKRARRARRLQRQYARPALPRSFEKIGRGHACTRCGVDMVLYRSLEPDSQVKHWAVCELGCKAIEFSLRPKGWHPATHS